MQAILTRFIPPSNVRGSRYSASCAAGRVIVSADHALDPEGNHIAAAQALCDKISAATAKKYGTDPKRDGWQKPRVAGCLPNGDFAHVFKA